ncbi:amidase [Corynebacterium falsenii DSM 44353]|uniref:isochorismatase family protein n=1 Tax=Corynebacterium falsenii TaxID=108486 RepID=UPI0003E96724|nr:isochorismatase family protein [Corynebacterium falsenii]AHI03577.1 amidase [Corynebacterium falsenii DSM 44353]MDC7104650.1 isochorismatase family protein [Corynebacterium falsenii]UBI04295.1 isochorismatase family protein [Corynebacterium falsenii]
MSKAVLVVDVQNDFVDGSLGTARGVEVARGISSFLSDADMGDNTYVVGTMDWHIDPKGHFSDEPDYVDTWPVHCVANSHGAQVCSELDADLVQVWFRKGEYTAAYSGFEGHLEGANDTLEQWLRSREVEKLTVVGIATDFCVRATVLDALKAGFDVRVIERLCSAVTEQGGKSAIQEMEDAGAEIVRG